MKSTENHDYLRDCRLYVITDRTQQRGRSNEAVIRAASAGGARVFQYREKELSKEEILKEAYHLRGVTRELGVKLIINDHLDVAMEIGADGVHLGQEDFPAIVAREILPPGMTLGVSARRMDLIEKAVHDGATAVGVGPVYATQTKANLPPPIGLEFIAEVVRAFEEAIPVIAIGGIKAHNVADVIRAGARRVAVVSGIVAAADPEAATREILTAIDEALR